jgi:hypothetical protein
MTEELPENIPEHVGDGLGGQLTGVGGTASLEFVRVPHQID